MTLILILVYCLTVDPWCHLPPVKVVPLGDGCNTCTVERIGGRYDYGSMSCTLLACPVFAEPEAPMFFEKLFLEPEAPMFFEDPAPSTEGEK